MDSERIFFVTTITALRRPIFRDAQTAELLMDVLNHYRGQGKFLLHEFVIMPDHVRALLTPAPGISLERAMQFIKGGFRFAWRRDRRARSGRRVLRIIAYATRRTIGFIVGTCG